MDAETQRDKKLLDGRKRFMFFEFYFIYLFFNTAGSY